MKQNKTLKFIAVALTALFVVTGCGVGAESSANDPTLEAGGGPEGQPQMGGTLRIAAPGGGPSTPLDPNSQSYLIDSLVKSAVYDRLTNIDPESGETVMALAQSMTPNADATQWTIKLNPGVYFSDGSPLTATDVLATLQRVTDDELAGSITETMALNKSYVVNEHELFLQMAEPFADLPAVLANASTWSIFPADSQDPATTPPLGTGPYAIEEYTPGVEVKMKGNSHYREEGKPYLDSLILVEISEPSATLNALQAGQVDMATRFSFSSVPTLENDDGVYLRINSGVAAANYYMNQKLEPFDEPAVRKALRMAVDRERCVDVGLNGYGHVGNDLWGESSASYNDELPQIEYDPSGAKEVLEEAGVSLPVEIELYTTDYGAGMLECAQIIEQSAQEAGFDVTIRQVSASELYGSDIFAKVPMGSDYWGATSFESAAAGSMLSSSPFPEFGMDDPEFEAKFAQARSTVDTDERNALYRELQEDLWENGSNIVWGYQDTIWGINNRVGGTEQFDLPTRSAWYPGLENLWVEK